jgi:hypothetical protein
VKSGIWIESLTVENLGPFVGRRTFNFGSSPEEPFTFILGSGKTSLVNALCWVFDLRAAAIPAPNWVASAVSDNGDHFSVESDFQRDGVGYTVRRSSLASKDFVAPEVSIIHFDDHLACEAVEEEFFRNGVQSSGALLLYALTKFLNDFKNRGDFRPIVFDDPFGRLDFIRRREAFNALFSHPAQIIFCGGPYDSGEMLDRGCAIRVLEI